MKKLIIWAATNVIVVMCAVWVLFDFMVNLRSEWIKFDTQLKKDRGMFVLCQNSTIENILAPYHKVCRDLESNEAIGAFALALKSMLDPEWLKEAITDIAQSLGYLFLPSCACVLVITMCCPTLLYFMVQPRQFSRAYPGPKSHMA